jgi:cob(I)alamin adenosyltransferase
MQCIINCMKTIDFDLVTTKGGDTGETSLYDGSRYRKDDLLFHTVGDVDELNSWLGVVKNYVNVKYIETIQKQLFKIGAMVATPTKSEEWKMITELAEKDLLQLEKEQNKIIDKADIPLRFIIPGETKESAWVDVARTVCRRTERDVVSCIRDKGMTQLIPCQKYLNRLSDYLFVLGRFVEHDARRVR